MYNDRPISDARMQEALTLIHAILKEYDLAGCVQLINGEEWAYTYRLVAEWNAVYADENLPIGMRLKAKSDVPGDHEKLEAAAHVFASMKDFGAMTIQVAQDFMLMLKEAGITIEHTPFGGEAPPAQLLGLPFKEFEAGSRDFQPVVDSRAARRRRKHGRR